MLLKKFISSLVILVTILFTSSVAQDTKMSFKLAQLAEKEGNSNKLVSVLIKGNVNYLREEIRRMNGVFKFAAGDICSVTIPSSFIKTLSFDPNVLRMEEGRLELEPMNDMMLINNKIDIVHQGISPLTQGYDGNGVIVGIIDSGIDFTHPDFKDSLGNTRVLWIWDHTISNGNSSPQPYNYGRQFSAANINSGSAIAHIDTLAHGTHVTGIATSNGNSDSTYTGAAPKADIIAVSVDFNKPDDLWLSSVADAVEYIFNKADSLGKPCVINISAGTYFGSHDGKDLSAKAIDNLISAKNGRSVVAAAGNAGNYAYHVQHAISNDTAFTWFKQNGNNPIFIELWADTADLNNIQFTIGADNNSPFLNNRGQDSWTNITSNLGILKTDTLFSINGNKLARYQRYGQLIDDKYSMVFYIIPDSSTYYFRLITKGTGKLDIWNFDMINSGLPSPSLYPGITNYAMPDYTQTICSSFQASEKVITVGQYVNRNNYVDYNGILQTFPITQGDLAVSSSRGPTRDGRNKPDITSTGEYTLSAAPINALTWFIANQPYKVAQSGKHLRDGGTSSAAPAVAGAIALYFQKNPTANWLEIKNKITLCSSQDIFTGTNLPNNDWGFGKLDAFKLMIGCVAANINELANDNFSIYPNPSNEIVNIDFNNSFIPNEIKIIDILGKEVFSTKNTIKSNQIKTDNLQSGIYFIELNYQNKTISKKLIISKN